MRWRGAFVEAFRPVLVVEKERVGLRLEAVRAATLTRIEFRRSQISHDLPITVALENILESSVADISNVERLVLFVEKEPAWRDKPIARHLRDKRRSVTS